MKISEAVRIIRGNLSYRQFSRKIGLSHYYIFAIEKEKYSNLTQESLNKLGIEIKMGEVCITRRE